MEEVTRYPFRWPLAYAEVAVPALGFAGLVAVNSSDQQYVSWVGVAVLVVTLVWFPVSVRRRSLTCWPGGLVTQLDQYRLSVEWEDLVRLQERRYRRLVTVEELVFRQSRANPVTSRGRDGKLPHDVDQHPGETRVMVSLFDKDWRSGPIGAHARAAGLDV